MISLMVWNLRRKDTKQTDLQTEQRLKDREQTYEAVEGKKGGGKRIVCFGIYAAHCQAIKMDNKQGPTVLQPCSCLAGQPGWKGKVWGEWTHVCV